MLNLILQKYYYIFVSLLILCIFISGFLVDYFNNVNAERLEVHFLDVGQGDGIFIKTPSQKTVMIDGGKVGSGSVMGATSHLSFYNRKLDVLIITHFDFDHSGGVIDILKYFEVEKIVVSQTQKENDFTKYLWNLIKEEGAEIVEVYGGDKIIFNDGAVIEILSPVKNNLYFTDNQSSIVARLIYKDKSFLFTGDIDKRIERSLVTQNLNIDSDILKVSHHGSNSSSIKEFIDEVSPNISVIQVGKNRYGHPHPDVLEVLKESTILRNDTNKKISFYIK